MRQGGELGATLSDSTLLWIKNQHYFSISVSEAVQMA